MKSRDLVFRRPDDSEVLVTLWEGHPPTMAERGGPWESWGPPIPVLTDESIESLIEREKGAVP